MPASSSQVQARPSVLATLFAPDSLAIVGASDRSRWSAALCANLEQGGFRGRLHLVNRSGTPAHGRTTAKRCQALGEKVEIGIVMVPAASVSDALRDLAESGARAAVILSSGFAETGEAGERLQAEAVAQAHRSNLRLVGPNSLGLVSFTAGLHAWTTPLRAPSRASGVAIVSQSGATAYFLTELAWQQDLGVSLVAATGNEADLDASAFIDHAIDDPATRAIAVFIETVRQPERFMACAARAAAVGKPIVVLKVGASEAVRRSAQAHTGALVGDDRIFTAVCRQYGLIRVHSVEQLLATADIAGRCGRLRPGGLAIISNSGGICEIAAESAEALGFDVPPLDTDTANQLRAALPGFGTPNNPLDLTGGVEPAQCEQAVRLMADRPGIAAALCIGYPIPLSGAEESERLTAVHHHLSAGLNALPVPGLMTSYTHTRVNDHARTLLQVHRAPYSAFGLDRVIQALAQLRHWSDFLRRRTASPIETPRGATAADARLPGTEQEALQWLASHGVPVVPHRLARTVDQAVAAARDFACPVALKIASPDIAHKSDIGGVILNVMGDAAVSQAHTQLIAAAAQHAPRARIDGVLVAPMRTGGIELLVGVARDPDWGGVLAVGLGGVWVEALQDVALRVLPVDAAEVRQMLSELKGARLLDGRRGLPPTDLDALALVIVSIAQAAQSLGPALGALDINPLRVCGREIEALDALCIGHAPH